MSDFLGLAAFIFAALYLNWVVWFEVREWRKLFREHRERRA